MLNDRGLLRGLFLIAIALLFGLRAVQYPLGSITRAGPGMFPLAVSVALGLVGLATVLRSRFAERLPLAFSFRNVGLILLSLLGFALLSQSVNMAAAIIFLVFCATLAAPGYSWRRNLQVTAGLLVIAFLFQRLFGLELNLY